MARSVSSPWIWPQVRDVLSGKCWRAQPLGADTLDYGRLCDCVDFDLQQIESTMTQALRMARHLSDQRLSRFVDGGSSVGSSGGDVTACPMRHR